MDIINLLDNKELTSLEKREEIAAAIRAGFISIEDIKTLKSALNDKKMTLVLEAMEAVSNKTPAAADLEWVKFIQDFLSSKSNNHKREASRIIGNIAHMFPDDLNAAVPRLLENIHHGGTVVRWGSAYALGRIIQIPQYANSELYGLLADISEREQNNGVKNQMLSGLKKGLS